MTTSLKSYWVKHMTAQCHVAFESVVAGCDCDPKCQKLPELLAFFAFLGEREPLLVGP